VSRSSEPVLTVTTDAKLTSITCCPKGTGTRQGLAGGAAGELTKVGRRGSECVSKCVRGLAAPGDGLRWSGIQRKLAGILAYPLLTNKEASGKRGGVLLSYERAWQARGGYV